MRGYFSVFEKNEERPAAKSRFSVNVERVGTTSVLHCAGRLCFEGHAKLLAESALESLSGGDDVILELAAVDMVDSAGIGQLVLVHMQAQALDRNVCIASAPDRVRKLLELTNVAALFDFFDSLDAALISCPEQVA
jgi:anti-anti-sigma factor